MIEVGSSGRALRVTVAALCAATGESKTQLGRGIGLTQQQVSRRQLGATSWTLDDCDRLAAYYGITVPQLLAGPSAACDALPAARRTAGRPAAGATAAER